MIRNISARSVAEAAYGGLHHLARFGKEAASRNGPVIVSPDPVVIIYENPANRVLVNPTRDANPFFHLFESLWMLAGRNDLDFPQKFVSTFDQFSDDGETLHGAYGYRWREFFHYDQLKLLVQELRSNPDSRRCVLQMWDGQTDLKVALTGGKDVPCNTAAFFDTLGGKLNMTVTCRSNDAILGAFGANAVHFSILLEWVSAATGIPMGKYRQFSNNFHAYTELYEGMVTAAGGLAGLADSINSTDVYSAPGALRTRDYNAGLRPWRLVGPGDNAEQFMEECEEFCDDVMNGAARFTEEHFESSFHKHVTAPMFETWVLWKIKDFEGAKNATLHIQADDWRAAAQSWLSVREQRRMEKQA